MNSKLLRNLKSHKFVVVFLLFLLITIILFINRKSLFKIIEGNNAACKYTNQEQLEKDVDAKAEKYKKENNQNPSVGEFGVKNVLGRVDDVRSKTGR